MSQELGYLLWRHYEQATADPPTVQSLYGHYIRTIRAYRRAHRVIWIGQNVIRPRKQVPAASSGEGQAGDLPLHGRRAVASGNARPQAEAGRDARPADARVVHQGQPIAQLQGRADLLGAAASVQKVRRVGAGNLRDLSAYRLVADEICIIRSLVTEAINHDPAHTFMNTGTTISGRPSMGSPGCWYGLGSEAENLPGFVVLTSIGGSASRSRSPPAVAQRAFCPAASKACSSARKGDPVLYVTRPQGVTPRAAARRRRRRRQLNKLAATSRRRPRRSPPASASTKWPSRCSERARADRHFRRAAARARPVRHQGADGTFAANCLLARRLAERGVRFIQLYHRGWDHHGGVKEGWRPRPRKSIRRPPP
jgi:hypothetical protein